MSKSILHPEITAFLIVNKASLLSDTSAFEASEIFTRELSDGVFGIVQG
jgi:hypothetical protein